MSDGPEYPKWITRPDGLKVEVTSAADEARWQHPPNQPHTASTFGASPMVENPATPSVKKGKGASHA